MPQHLKSPPPSLDPLRFSGGLSVASIQSIAHREGEEQKLLHLSYECPSCGLRMFTRDNSINVPSLKCACGEALIRYCIEVVASEETEELP